MVSDLDEFWGDLSSAARACVQAPMLPLISVILILPAEVLPLFPLGQITAWLGVTELLLVAFGVFSVGWVGMQRIWFRRIFEGRPVTGSEVWGQSWGFFYRYLILGLTVGFPYLVLIVWLIVPVGSGTRAQHRLPNWWLAFSLAYSFVLDIVLTFVTPALAFATRRVSEAWKIGITMIGSTWPKSAAYTIAPPLTLLGLATLNPTRLPALVAMLFAVVSVLIGMVLKGAIAAYFLRHSPVRASTTS